MQLVYQGSNAYEAILGSELFPEHRYSAGGP
jgi:hypothetical protein